MRRDCAPTEDTYNAAGPTRENPVGGTCRWSDKPVPALRDEVAIIGYHLEVLVTDMLIRDVPDDVVAAVDARASRLGLSRSEYVRRRLAQDAAGAGATVSTEDLARFSDLFGDLADPDVMSQAWR
jgi:hypothetical protein